MPVAILVHGDRSCIVSTPTSQEDLMVKVKRFLSLNELDEDKLILVIHPDWSDTPLELDPSALSDFHLPDKSRITITMDKNNGNTADEDDGNENDEDHEDDGCNEDDNNDEDYEDDKRNEDEEENKDPDPSWGVYIKVVEIDREHDSTSFHVSFRTPMDTIMRAWNGMKARRTGGPSLAHSRRYIHEGKRVSPNSTAKDLGMIDGDIIHTYVENIGGKPAIYLLTPEAIPNLNMAVHLNDDWNLTVLYPPIKSTGGLSSKSSASWTVDAKGNGVMYDHATAMETSCLFWEAKSLPPKGGPIIDPGNFTPNMPNLTMARSQIIQRDDLVPYLYKCLEALCLTPSMRTDFITFWLPKFHDLQSNNFDIVLNFVKQTEYEKAARLTFSQEPDAVVRIFMVFGGVLRGTEEHAEWTANQGGPETPEGWRDVVGISKEVLDIMADQTKFRAVEWGAMYAVPSFRGTLHLGVGGGHRDRGRFS